MIIVLPKENQKRCKQLEIKLGEYWNRLTKGENSSLNLYKICILTRLISSEQVNIDELRVELVTKYENSFDYNEFMTACEVINGYCINGGKDLFGGSGLPKV